MEEEAKVQQCSGCAVSISTLETIKSMIIVLFHYNYSDVNNAMVTKSTIKSAIWEDHKLDFKKELEKSKVF